MKDDLSVKDPASFESYVFRGYAVESQGVLPPQLVTVSYQRMLGRWVRLSGSGPDQPPSSWIGGWATSELAAWQRFEDAQQVKLRAAQKQVARLEGDVTAAQARQTELKGGR